MLVGMDLLKGFVERGWYLSYDVRGRSCFVAEVRLVRVDN
jgi:hypothetical protein